MKVRFQICKKIYGITFVAETLIDLLNKNMFMLTHLLNNIIKDVYFPYTWKYTLLPAHESGLKNYISNDRPISILPIFSKVFESILYDRVLAHVNS